MLQLAYHFITHFVPTTERTSTEGLAQIFRDNIQKLHGLPDSIISNRGPQFTVGIIRELNHMLGIETKLSMAFHPQTDSQIERMNQELEQYLHMFIDHRQEQWPEQCHELPFSPKLIFILFLFLFSFNYIILLDQ